VRKPFGRGIPVPDEVLTRAGLARRDRVLAHTATDDGCWLLGTRDALVIVEPVETIRVAWEQVETADWDREESRLKVAEVGDFGRPRPVHVFTIPEPGSLLPMIRERVTASIVLQRRVPVVGKRGLTVVARRPPHGTGEVTWAYELDEGIDPDDPAVREAAATGLRDARDELGG